MKTLKLLTICCLLISSGTLIAQKKDKKSWIIIESIKNHPTLGDDFKQKAVAVAELGGQLPAKGLGNFEIQDLMNTIIPFEKAALNGKGQDVIMPKHIRQARTAHSGKTKQALVSRLRLHMLQMERVFEDDE